MGRALGAVLLVFCACAPRVSGVPTDVSVACTIGACAVAVYCASSSFQLVSQGNCALVERLGKYDRMLGPGLHFKLPFAERISALLSVRERVLDVPPQRCISSDNAPLTADAVVFYRIRDLRKAVYAIDDFEVGLQNLVLTQLRSEIGQMSLDATFSARERLNAILLREANVVTDGWGIDVIRVEVRDILPSKEIVNSMELQLAAERQKRAEILRSEGLRQSQINAAEAGRDSVVLRADGERKRLEAEAAGVCNALDVMAAAIAGPDQTPDVASRVQAAHLMLERARIDANLALAKSPNAKVVLAGGARESSSSAAPLVEAAALMGTTLATAASGSSSPDLNFPAGA